MKKTLIILVLALLLVVGLLAAGWGWLFNTRAGAEWALARAAAALPALHWQRVEGSLRSGLVIHRLTATVADAEVLIGRAELALRVHWRGAPRIELPWLRALAVDVRWLQGAADTAAPAAFRLPDLASPLAIHLHEGLVSPLTIHLPAADRAPLRIDRIELAGRYFDRLELTHLNGVMAGLDAQASGHWGLSAPFGGELQLTAGYLLPATSVQRLAARLHGDLKTLRLELASEGPARLEGQIDIADVLPTPTVQVALHGRLGDWPGRALAIEDFSLQGTGTAAAWNLALTGSLLGPAIPANRWHFDLAGKPRSVAIEQGQIEVLDGQIGLDGQLALGADPQAQLAIDFSALDLTLLYPDWPQQARLNGRFELDASRQGVHIEQLSINAPPAALTVQGHGRWVSESDELSAALSWHELSWPPVLDHREPLLYSPSGRLNLSGQLSDWQAELDAVLRLLGQAPARITAAAGGSQSAAAIEHLQIDAGTAGRLRTSGQIAWAPEPGAALQVQLEQFDPGQFLATLPGRVDLNLSLALAGLDAMQIELHQLAGELGQQPLRGSGRIEASRTASQGGELSLDLGDNRLRISSADGQTWSLHLLAQALDQLDPRASGRLDGAVQLDLAQRQLHLDADLHAAGWADVRLQQGQLAAALNWAHESPAGQMQLQLLDLDLSPWERIDELTMDMDGDCLAHTARLTLAGQGGRLAAQARGALDSCVGEAPSAWSGVIDELAIDTRMAGEWTLEQALALAWSDAGLSAGHTCLVAAPADRGRLCLDQLSLAETRQAAITIRQVPMDLLLVPLDPLFELTTPLSGELQARWSQDLGLEHLAGFLALEAGVLKPLGDADSLLDIESIRLDLLPEADHLRLVLDARLEGDSHLSGQAQLLDLNRPASAMLDARARLNLPDIGVFNRLATELDQLGGRLSGEMAMRGALLAPTLQGQLRLDDGLLVHAPLGLRIEDLHLHLDGSEERASLSGQMRGGEGELTLNGSLQLVNQQWQLSAQLAGQQFVFSDVNWLRLVASPDVRLNRSGDGLITVDGDIHLDRLRAGLPPGAEQRIHASPDIRVIGEQEAEDPISALARNLEGRLAIHLGEDARTNAVGMQARLSGSLELLWDRHAIEPRARGIIRIPDGAYRAYGQNLRIQNGEVVFTGHAIDNPSLNIEALRDIFGDPQVEAAGVRIRGTARDPRINLFTQPPTSEEKALAYVVTGANFDHADGQAAINLGFYLLPRLFVSYGIGLFEAGNVLSGRFELSRRWGVRVVSGQRDTGVDLSFAVDR